MKDFAQRFPRLIGLLSLSIGIAFAIWLKKAYDSGESFEERAVLFTPYLILYGLMITIQPALFIPKGSFRQAPMIFKMLHIIVGIVGVGLGIYLRFVTFADWK